MYNGAKVLVTGGTGMIGRPLVSMLIDAGAHVRIAALDDPSRAHPGAEFMNGDLTDWDFCAKAVDSVDMCFTWRGSRALPASQSNGRPVSWSRSCCSTPW